MAVVQKTITLTEQQDACLRDRVASGSYTEAIRDLIRREQERVSSVESLRHALMLGEQSGEPERFDFVSFKRLAVAQYG